MHGDGADMMRWQGLGIENHLDAGCKQIVSNGKRDNFKTGLDHFTMMLSRGWLILVLSFVCVGLNLGAVASEDYADPLRPPTENAVSEIRTVPFFRIPERLKQVEQEIGLETQALDALAPLRPEVQLDEFGYHSDYIQAVDEVPEEPLWTLDFLTSTKTHDIGFVMVPALDRRASDLRGYAFPKRFRISLIHGRTERKKVCVDWTAEDFPDPGMRPVYFVFSGDGFVAKGVRLQVFGGHEENGLEYFSLGRVHLIRKDEQTEVLEVLASSSFESAPYWHPTYLASSRHMYGMPLATRNNNRAVGDLTLKLPVSKLENPLVIRVDLDKTEQLGWVNVFPAQSPGGIDIPGYGFPKTIEFYRTFLTPSGGVERRSPISEEELPEHLGNNMLRLSGRGKRINSLEIECNDFPVYQGQAVFALGEIEIFKGGQNLSKGRRVSIRGLDLEDDPEGIALVDGRVGGRDILSLADWLKQLAAGKPHELRLRALAMERKLLTEHGRRVKAVLLVSLCGLVFAGGLSIVLLMLRSRKQAEIQLRRQINADLHDDIGSKIAAISLASRDVEIHALEERVRNRGHWIGSVVQTMHQGLRDVLWLTNDQSDTLVLLVQKLAEIARQSVPESRLILRISDTSTLTDRPIRLQMKRDILLFAREALHNATTHAEATQIRVRVMIEKKSLFLCVADDGNGFDVPPFGRMDRAVDHLGLQTMRDRASNLGAEFQLRSSPGQGTSVELTVKL